METKHWCCRHRYISQKSLTHKILESKKSRDRFPKSLPSFGSIAPTVSGFKSTGSSYTWLLKEWIKGEGNDRLGSSNDIQTDNEWTRPDFESESSSAWPNIRATKLQEYKGFKLEYSMSWWHCKPTNLIANTLKHNGKNKAIALYKPWAREFSSQWWRWIPSYSA